MMTDYRRLRTPLGDTELGGLRVGDAVRLTGHIYTARDMAHMRMNECIQRGDDLPFDPEGAVIYYAGPAPPPPGEVIGSVGPTTSGRMDGLSRPLLKRGVKATIGKGRRSDAMRADMRRYGAIYLAAVGGAGALLAERVRGAELVAFPELGTEALRRLYVEDFPVTVVNDLHGGDLYEQVLGV